MGRKLVMLVEGVLLAAALALALLWAVAGLREVYVPWADRLYALPTGLLILAAALPSLVRRRRTRAAERRWAERRRLGRCPRCGYDLTGNASGTCPECGRLAASRSA